MKKKQAEVEYWVMPIAGAEGMTFIASSEQWARDWIAQPYLDGRYQVVTRQPEFCQCCGQRTNGAPQENPFTNGYVRQDDLR